MPWFFDEFLPPLMPLITAVAIILEVIFWGLVLLGVGALGRKFVRWRKKRRGMA